MPDTVRTKINEIYSCLQGSDTPVKIDIQVDCGVATTTIVVILSTLEIQKLDTSFRHEESQKTSCEGGGI